jgi:hypothetical protein
MILETFILFCRVCLCSFLSFDFSNGLSPGILLIVCLVIVLISIVGCILTQKAASIVSEVFSTFFFLVIALVSLIVVVRFSCSIAVELIYVVSLCCAALIAELILQSVKPLMRVK